ncbi:MAG: DUF488 domain-containing protein [Thermoanaerobaculaceae bacterium]|nr:DUF488 domain-containing protein [Thermoanaerobaculaceae bacterium]NLH10210.1 DUF488 domain-containing protein [Holophagae bacterium]
MEIYTIGFTQTSAERFFERLRNAGVRRLIDVRLNNVSQLAGFAKRDDLAFFLRELCGADYRHEPLLAPTQEMLDNLKKRGGSWADYERVFLGLMRERRVELTVNRKLLKVRSVFLCSEARPDQCHRRLAAEYLASHWGIERVVHL